MKKEYEEVLRRIFLTEHKSCSESVFEAALNIKGIEPEKKCFYMMRGFSGGLSSGHDCGAVTGGVAAISYLYYDGTAQKQDEVKALCKAFVEKAEAAFGTTQCKTLRPCWHKDDTVRCYALVERTLELLLETIG